MHLNKPSTVGDQQIKHAGDIVWQKDPKQIIITSSPIPRKIDNTSTN